ncbi:MAG: tRNA (adenosine(37)-N6)-dimethylallyltransferase MiaA, partial [Elusimicrobia bacterium RIFOXYB2_FULL_48_7]
MIFIVGPTCSGKTSTSIELAKKIKGAEIISADSRQVYKYFSVGTAKPAGKWEPLKGKLAFFCEGIAHHLVDFLDPGNYFSAGSFAELASEKAAEIKKRGGTPVFVGGTGLYIDSFINGIAAMPQRDETIREELLKLEKKRGRAYLHKKLEEADPISAKNIHPNNIHRV